MTTVTNIVVLISGNGSNLQAIIDSIESGQVAASISLVISSNPDAYGLTRAKNHGLPTQVIDSRNFAERSLFDQTLLQNVNSCQPDYIMLAGFMRILGVEFIQTYKNRIINIHPSILPHYKGLNTYQRALDNGESEHGVSIHIVTAELDNGPVLLQGRYTIRAGDSVADLQQKGHRLEHRMYPKLLQWLCTGDMCISGNSVVFRQQELHQPVEYSYV
ncbi:MAG: phosphoribosylglycinamide formyltransferase [Gammaproteobacteria bacterium]|nr:phosphoribosylglycinamide formyltransferase [Gammaproteobacteria bacterium]